jgi:hypothetical protein
MTIFQASNIPVADLYEQDFLSWLEITTNQLKIGQLSQVNLDYLIEELESMGRSEKQALEDNLIVVLMHLLKYQCQPNRRSNSWRFTIKEHRRRLHKAFKDSPSLKPYYIEVFAECYEEARDLAATETGLSLAIFPVICPFSDDEILNRGFLPE